MSESEKDKHSSGSTPNPGDLRREDEQPGDGSVNSNEQKSTRSGEENKSTLEDINEGRNKSRG